MRHFILFLVLLILNSLFLIRPPFVHAADYELLPAGQTIDSDYIRAGSVVQVDGDINGDAFLAGGVVTVNGKIDGDLFVLGGKVNINGDIKGSIRVLAGDVTVNGPVGRNIFLACGNCTVTRGTNITGSLLTAGANLELSAPQIGRGFRFFGSRLYLNSPISHEAFVVADREFLLGPNASVSGDLKYTGNSEAVLQSGATVAGRISYQKINQGENYPRYFGAQSALAGVDRVRPFFDLIGFFVSVLVGYIFLGLFPKIFEKVAMAIENRPAASFGWGVLTVLITPVVIVLFAITLIGIPVALVIALAAYIFWLIATYLVAFFLGRRILLSRFGERRGWSLILGFFLLYLLGLVPFIGSIVKLVIVLFGLGAIILSYKQPVIYEQKPLPFEAPRHRSRRR